MDSVAHWPDVNILCNGTPNDFAVEEEAERQLFGVNTVVSTPLVDMTSLIHRANVSLVAV